jgi:GT2 family glycosyltransferase
MNNSQQNSEHVSIILINWNRWTDTIECIESLLKQTYSNFTIFVLDNDSSDDSLERIESYVERKLAPHIPEDPTVAQYVAPIGTLPIKTKIISEFEMKKLSMEDFIPYSVVLIKNSKNYGFGYANNQILRLVAKAKHSGYAWILNNDTVQESKALESLILESNSDPAIGIVGSVLAYYDEPETLQCAGGAYFFPFLGFAKLYYKNAPRELLAEMSGNTIEKSINFLPGTSILVSQHFLKKVGVFDKDYFMYAEDIDLCYRAKHLGYRLRVAKDSIIYHKESKSTAGRKHMFYFLFNRGNTVFLKKHFTPFIFLISIPAMIAHTLLQSRNLNHVWYAIKGIFAGLKQPITSSQRLRK